MFMMFAELTGEWFTPEEKKRMEIREKWNLLDCLQWQWINFKMKYISYKRGREKYIAIGKIRKKVLEYMKLYEYKIKRYTRPTGEFYYYIYF